MDALRLGRAHHRRRAPRACGFSDVERAMDVLIRSGQLANCRRPMAAGRRRWLTNLWCSSGEAAQGRHPSEHAEGRVGRVIRLLMTMRVARRALGRNKL